MWDILRSCSTEMASSSVLTAHTEVPQARSASCSTCLTMSHGSTSRICPHTSSTHLVNHSKHQIEPLRATPLLADPGTPYLIILRARHKATCTCICQPICSGRACRSIAGMGVGLLLGQRSSNIHVSVAGRTVSEATPFCRWSCAMSAPPSQCRCALMSSVALAQQDLDRSNTAGQTPASHNTASE